MSVEFTREARSVPLWHVMRDCVGIGDCSVVASVAVFSYNKPISTTRCGTEVRGSLMGWSSCMGWSFISLTASQPRPNEKVSEVRHWHFAVQSAIAEGPTLEQGCTQPVASDNRWTPSRNRGQRHRMGGLGKRCPQRSLNGGKGRHRWAQRWGVMDGGSAGRRWLTSGTVKNCR